MPRFKAKSKISGEEFTFEWNGKGKPTKADVDAIVSAERGRRDEALAETKKRLPKLPPPTFGEEMLTQTSRPLMDVIGDPSLSFGEKAMYGTANAGLEGITRLTEMFSPVEAARSIGRSGALLADRPDLYPQQLRQQTDAAGIGVDQLPGTNRFAEAGAEALTGVLGLTPFPVGKMAAAGLRPAVKTIGRALAGGVVGSEAGGQVADVMDVEGSGKRLMQTIGGLGGGVAAGGSVKPNAPTPAPPPRPVTKGRLLGSGPTDGYWEKQGPAPSQRLLTETPVRALPAGGPPTLEAGRRGPFAQPPGQPVQEMNMLPPAPQPTVEGIPNYPQLPPPPTKQIGTTLPAGLLEPPTFPYDQPPPRIQGAMPMSGDIQRQLPAPLPEIGPFASYGQPQQRIPTPEPAGLLPAATPPKAPTKVKKTAPTLEEYAASVYGLDPAQLEAVTFKQDKWPGNTPMWVKGKSPLEIANEWQNKATNMIKRPVSAKRKKSQGGSVPLEVFEPVTDFVDAVVMPMGDRLRRVSPDLHDLLAKGKTTSHILAGTLSDKFSYSDVSNLSKSERWNMLHTLQGRGQPVNQKVQNAVDVFRSVSNDIVGAMTTLGGQISSSKGKRNFIPMNNYFPQTVPPTKSLKHGEVRQDVLQNIVDLGVRKTAKEAEAFLDNFITGRETGKWTQDILDYLQVTKQAKNDAEAMDMLNRMRQFSGRHSSLEYARDINVPFYDPDPARVLPWHVQTAGKRLGEIGTFGQNDEYVKTELAKIARAGKDVKEAEKWTESFIAGSAEGNTAEERLSRFVRAMQIPKLALAFIPNAAQTLNVGIAGDMQALFKGYAAAMTDKGRRFAVQAGALLEPSLLDTGHTGGGVKTARDLASPQALIDTANEYMLKPFKKTEQINRIVSANAGADFASRLHKIANAGGNRSKWAQDALRELGVDFSQPLRQKEILTAAHNFTKMTQFSSAPENLPAWASTWWGKTLAQFKNMAYQQTKFGLDQTVGEIMRGHPVRAGRNVIVGAALAGTTGEVVNAIRHKIKGKEREYESEAERIAQNMAAAQAIGIMTDAFDAIDRGKERDWILGPGVGWAIDAQRMGWDWITEDLPNKDMEMATERAKKFYYRHGPLGSTVRSRNEN